MTQHDISSFEEFAESIINVDARCMQTGIKRPGWLFNHFEVGSIQIQGGYEGCPLLFEGVTHQG